MSNKLTLEQAVTSLETVWQKIPIIKATFAPTLTEPEFAMFVGLGKSLGANPFNREIWAVKYGGSAAQIFLGRDFYRRKAQEQPNYKGHQVDAVYSNDEFAMVNGIPHHKYKITDRGVLVGAYCVVHKTDCQPYHVFCELSEYDSNQSNWKTKKATMIKKVAEAQGLRGAFQGVFSGTYDESEITVQQAPTQEEERVKQFIAKAQSADELELLYDTIPEKYHSFIDAKKEELEVQNV